MATTTTGHMTILPGFKTCSHCKEILSIEKFYRRSRGGARADCISCCLLRNKNYYIKNKKELALKNKTYTLENKEKIKSAKMRRKFGIAIEEKILLFAKQGNKCAICGCTENNVGRDWDIDHCHKTGKIRGILCSNCNRGLGLFQDNLENLRQACKYLENDVQ